MTSESEHSSKLFETLAELDKFQEEAEMEWNTSVNKFWNSLTKAEQLKAFHAVVSRIYEGEIKQKGTYRYILYEVFGFGPEAYGIGMDCGFMYLHNAINDGEELNGYKRSPV